MASSPLHSPPPGPWVMSPLADVLSFLMPMLLAFVIRSLTQSLPDDDVPLRWWIPMGVLVDVSHVYGTLFRTVLDSEATLRNWALYLVAGPGMLLVALFVNLVLGTTMGWSLLAYFAIFHFGKQPFGFMCLYKARCGERARADHLWDFWTCMAGALIPVLLDHTAPEKTRLGWFNTDDQILFHLPGCFAGPLHVAYAVVPVIWVGRLGFQYWMENRPPNLGKVLIMAIQWTNWYVGTTDHQLTALAFHNMFHGISSMFLVYYAVSRRLHTWQKESPATMNWQDRANVALMARPWRYLALMFVLGFIEEFSWDGLVHQEHFSAAGFDLKKPSETEEAIWTSILMLPQLSHYFLDGFIWRMSPQNPGLREALLQFDLPAGGSPSEKKRG